MEPQDKVTHVCVLDDKPTSVISPIVDPAIPSQKLVIITPPHLADEAARILKLTKTRGYQAEIAPLPDTRDLAQLKERFLAIFGSFNVDEQVWLNISNGNRYHTTLAFDAARLCDAFVYAVDPEQDEIQWITPHDRQPIPIQDKLKLHEYFSIRGYTLIAPANNAGIAAERRQLGTNWASKATVYSKALAKLNYLARTAQGKNHTSIPLSKELLDDDQLQQLIDDLQACDLVRYDNQKISFMTHENQFFCNGGWLEEYVYGLLSGLRKEIRTIQDIALSGQIERQLMGKTLKNELDAIALVNNKLHLIECKTKRFDQGSGSNTLYKIDSLNDLMGDINGRAALVSFQPMTKSEQLRAKELEVEFFGPEHLGNLSDHLRGWLQRA